MATFGYGEIQAEYGSSVLMQAFREELGLTEGSDERLPYFEGDWGRVAVHRRRPARQGGPLPRACAPSSSRSDGPMAEPTSSG